MVPFGVAERLLNIGAAVNGDVQFHCKHQTHVGGFVCAEIRVQHFSGIHNT